MWALKDPFCKNNYTNKIEAYFGCLCVLVITYLDVQYEPRFAWLKLGWKSEANEEGG
jgi:hypothetical protein